MVTYEGKFEQVLPKKEAPKPKRLMKVEEKTHNESIYMSDIATQLIYQFRLKNVDYGDSMGKQCEQFESLTPIIVRMADKMNRIIALNKNGEALVKDDSFEDSIGDLITYALMLSYEYSERKGERLNG
jgi:hypothetical protein